MICYVVVAPLTIILEDNPGRSSMQCSQLTRLIKGWYLHVKEETMAPARMMQFVDEHVRNCDVCNNDLELAAEIEKIREFVLPESKIPKAYRTQEAQAAPEISPEKNEVDTSAKPSS